MLSNLESSPTLDNDAFGVVLHGRAAEMAPTLDHIVSGLMVQIDIAASSVRVPGRLRTASVNGAGGEAPFMWVVLLAAALFASAVGCCLAASGSVTTAMAVHGALMLTAWGLLMPAGGIAARYFKVMPGQDFPRVVENLTWWRWHRGLQYGGMALATAAFAVILSETGGRFDTLHGRCGLAVMALGWLQVVSGLLRGTKGGPTDRGADPLDPATWRGDHYDLTRRRHAFEAWHKSAGWAVLVLSAVTVLLGLQLVGDPVWLLFVVGALQAGAGLALFDGAARRRWVDTYASLWGPDPRHPGNR